MNILFAYPALAVGTANTDQVAVAIVIDNSGSMADTDPLNIRFSASQMVLEIMGESDFLSITTFGNEAVNLLPMTELIGEQFLVAKASLATIPVPSGYTDYQKALALAEANLAALPDQNMVKFIIFLTDGVPEVGDLAVDMVQYIEQLKTKATELGTKGIPIYTVGFGGSDPGVLNQMSGLTRGTSVSGESSTTAISFFEILQKFKNRYTLVDAKVAKTAETFQFNVDQYTSRVTILIHDETQTGQITMVDDTGQAVQPVLKTGLIQVYHLNQNPEKESVDYTLTGTWTGSIRAVRDTKTKLWINEPINNSQVPFESEIKAKVGQTGVIADNTNLLVTLKQNGSELNQPMEIIRTGSDYEIKLGKMPQTGMYEMEVSLMVKKRLIAKTSSKFDVKNIPNLSSELLDEAQTWIENEPKRVTASMQKDSQPVTINLENVEITLDIAQGEEKTTVALKDDGKAAAGDLIAGDGVYSALVGIPKTGDISYMLSARGDYNKEPFFLSSTEVKNKVESPGSVEIKLPQSVTMDEAGNGVVEIQLTNKAAYPEELTPTLGETALFSQTISVPPGETINKKVAVSAAPGIKEIAIGFKPLYSVTSLAQETKILKVVPAGPSGGLSLKMVFGLGLAAAAILAGIVLFRKIPRRGKQSELQGKLIYSGRGENREETIVFSGKKPLIFTIGKDRLSERHIDSAVNPGFQFTIYPIHSDSGTAVVELQCQAPGLLKKHGVVMTSAILAHGDEFDMADLHFKYFLDTAHQDGQNVLSGRL